MYINYDVHNCNIKSIKLKLLLIKHISKIILYMKKYEIQHNYDHTAKYFVKYDFCQYTF